jgi:hypothetical protein
MTDPLTPHECELYEERAGIIQFCGNIPKAEAERLAMKEITDAKSPFQRSLLCFSDSEGR